MKINVFRLENPVDIRTHKFAKELPARPGERVFLTKKELGCWELREAIVVSDTRAGRPFRWYRAEDYFGYPDYINRDPKREFLSVADFKKKLAKEELVGLDSRIASLRESIKYNTRELDQLLKQQAKLKGKK